MINKRLKSCPKTFQISRSGEISPNMVTLKVTANADILFFKSDKNRYILSELFLHGADLYKS